MDVPSSRSQVKRRRVIFNLDSNTSLRDTERFGDGDIERYIEYVFAGLDSRYVDALFWMDGAGGNTANYDSQVLELTGQRIGKVSPQLRRWIAEGNDPPKVVVREARKRGLDVFFSFRINDIHDAFSVEGELATFKVEHPEWTIGKGFENCAHTSLNFAVPEVRQLKFEIVREIFEKYDFDGIEIDFMRGPPFFIPGQEPENAHILTEFLRKVRGHLEQRGQERGRPIEIAAHAGENLEACDLDGFDVATWMRERLIDILVLGSGTIDMEVEGFKTLAEGTGVLIYPCIYGWPSGYRFAQFDGKGGQGGLSPELARGLAVNYWHQGADGVYTLNWFPGQEQLSYQAGLLAEIADPEALRGKDKLFAADRGGPAMAYPHNWLHTALPATLGPDTPAEVPIMVGEDLSAGPKPETLEMRIECEPMPDVGTLSVTLDGEPLPRGKPAASRIIIPLTATQLRRGHNQVTIALSSGEAEVQALEVYVGYSADDNSAGQ